ncbi:3-dehydroquinate synthase [Clostridiaceae bacterium UIB06]|uniref:3-dehydroquinate synthase n=1 Tax=Clostridium thailandense TaxID=2794346 RepID=A0A949TID7_9CLOT|nr:AroB-related putative sugar phosphate phospholyase (cyclizing) [Clostridium thailandense]MBV7272805.1 3-dehydroquinate synthase [Clostridium thailandense]MCH5137654.1 3-dehydroquinate synthase [Clostridiaceae bacterium UIB06]
MIIKSSTKEYIVNIEKDFKFVEMLKKKENALFVIDRNLYNLYYRILFQDIQKEKIYIIEAIETNKTIESALSICEVMTKIPAKRNVHLLSFGGGIVQDITGFVANILYRGISWTFVPTTLLASCDSCIGGKTSLNYKQYKNLLGTFYPPDQIYICSQFFNTLSDYDFKSGLGEIVKFNIMYGEQGITKIENNIEQLLARNKETLDEFVEKSLIFKKGFIEEDEFDKGIRIHLNFAHTFGHAFEAVSNYMIPHGTAVAIGTLVANRISFERGLLKEDIVTRIETIIKKIINVDLLQTSFNLDKIVDAMRKDKKQINDNLTAVLLYGNMQLKVYHDLEKKEIKQAISFVSNILK